MKRRIISLLLAFSLVCSINVCASDISDNSNEFDALSYVSQYALEFMQTSQQNTSITVDNVKEFYDLNGSVTAYYVTFQQNSEPAGYVLLSLLTGDNDPIVEFSFDGSGIFDYADGKAVPSNAEIIYTGPDRTFVRGENGTLYSIYDQCVVSDDVVCSDYNEYLQTIAGPDASIASFDNGGIIDWANARIVSCVKIPDFGLGEDYFIQTDFSSGNVCAATAATNIIWYWATKKNCTPALANIPNSSSKYARGLAIFDIMHTAMGTTYNWGTWSTWVLKGYKAYFGRDAASGGTWNYKYLSTSATFSDYKAAIQDECPIHLQLRTSSSELVEGHDVFCLGYATGSSSNYLIVMDGWHSYGRCVKYGYYSNMKGYKIWVNSTWA